MSSFDETRQRLKNVHARIPAFPEDLMRVVRMTHHIHKRMKDLSNAALRKYELVDASYVVLMALYGSENETSTASTLGEACMEKPANLTRVCNELEEKGLIVRGNRPGDRRCVMITLTDAGRELVSRIWQDVWASTVRSYDNFTPEEIGQLEQMLRRQLTNLEKLT